MALPLKSGADLYNNQALRLRLHNLGADPTEVGAGLIYFNTSTGLNTSQKARLYTGSAWKTIAFSEDLDVASNADFLALKDRVDLLSGDVDTDAIISNMKEVSAFLEGFAEDASLMDLLNGKLDKTGGTINGNLNVNGDITTKQYLRITAWKGYGTGEAKVWFNGDSKDVQWQDVASMRIGNNTLLHSGNVGDYALKIDGSNKMSKGILFSDRTLTEALSTRGTGIEMFKLVDNSSVSPTGSVYFSVLNAVSSYSGLQLAVFGGAESTLYYRKIGDSGTWSAWKTIAFTDSNVASATKLETARTIWGQSFDGTGNVSGALYLGTGAIRSSKSGTDRVFIDFGSAGDPYIGYGTASAGIDSHLCGNNIYLHYGTSRTNGLILNSSGNVTIGESDMAGTSAKLYVDGSLNATGLAYLSGGVRLANATYISSYIKDDNGSTTITAKSIMGVNASNNLLIAYGLQTTGATGIYGKRIYFASNGEAIRMLINESGNVLIGTTTDNGAKLQVGGDISIPNNHYISFNNTAKTPLYQLWMTGNDVFFVGRGSVENGHDSVYCGKTIRFSTGDSAWNNSASIDEEGNFHISGNLIVDGEVSAGGRAEEGGNAGGGGAFHSESIAVGATQTTIAHGLGTDDIVVSIYEKDGVSGRWSIILTDVEIVDANNIIVSFGSATNVEHKVVIMGAVA